MTSIVLDSKLEMKVVVLKLPKHVSPPPGYILVKELRKENVYNMTIQVPKKVSKKKIEDELSILFGGFGLGDNADVKVAEDFNELNELIGKMTLNKKTRGSSKTRKYHK
jgi:hypothetical protein